MTAPKFAVVASRGRLRVEASVSPLDPLSTFGEALARRVAELLLEAHAHAPASAAVDRAAEPDRFKPKDAAKVLNVGRTTMNGIIRRREIKVTRVGRSIRIARADLDEYLAKHTSTVRSAR